MTRPDAFTSGREMSQCQIDIELVSVTNPTFHCLEKAKISTASRLIAERKSLNRQPHPLFLRRRLEGLQQQTIPASSEHHFVSHHHHHQLFHLRTRASLLLRPVIPASHLA